MAQVSKEFNLKLGSAGKGLISSVLAFVKFFVVPFMVLNLILTIGDGSGGEWWPKVKVLIEEMMPLVIVFGIAITAVAFGRGFYPKGSYPRAVFSAVCAVLVMIYAYMLMLGGDVQSFFDSEDIALDVMFVFLLFALLLVIRTLQHLGELPDHRHEFLTLMAGKLGTPMPEPLPVEDVDKHRFYHDLRLRYGRLEPGFKDMRKAAGKYLAWPVFLLIIIGIVITKIGDSVPVEFKNELDGLVGTIALIGAAIAVLMFFKGFYPKGSVSRMAFWIPAAGCICLWIWYLSFGGDVAIELMDLATIELDYTPIIMLFIIAAALWAVYAIVEMVSYRKDWKANNFQPVDDKKISAMKKLKKKEAKEKAKAEKLQKKLDEKRSQGKD
ncbi:MAG: hypothetical protein HPY73_01340 [Methanomassiliicoccales archaeon]|nr:MAG: hypothetical protein HPY73_01340 [Methanomassiliicoccales archaeon]